MRRHQALLREAIASAVSQPVASAVTMLMIAGMLVAVLLTTGRTVGAEQQVLASIDSGGTRSIVVRADPDAGLTADVLLRLANVDGIEWAAAFSSAIDATNSEVPDGTRAPVRLAYGDHLDRLGVPADSPAAGELAFSSADALRQFGLAETAGSVTTIDGETYGVGGVLQVPDYLQSFEPLTVVPQADAPGDQPVSLLVVIATEPELVTAVSDVVTDVLAVEDPAKVSLETSASLAQLRTLIQAQLSSFSRGLVLVMLTLTGALVAIILYSLVMMRRKDFGRRRALGATRGFIVGLLLVQTGLLALVGVVAGAGIAAVVLIVAGDPLPAWEFFAAVGLLAVATALLAALVPAVAASRRDPIKELRVP